MARGQSLQDPFLNALRKERVPVSIYLVNGIKLQGQIDSFDHCSLDNGRFRHFAVFACRQSHVARRYHGRYRVLINHLTHAIP